MTPDPRQTLIEQIAHSRAIDNDAGWWECMHCEMDGPRIEVLVQFTPLSPARFRGRPTHNLNCPVIQCRLLLGWDLEKAMRYDWEHDD